MRKTSLVTGAAMGALLAVGVVSQADAADPPTPKPGWADNTSVSGRMYWDISHIDHKNNGVKQADTGTGFDIKRFYVGIDHKFNDTYSGNLTMDANYVSNDGETQFFIKKAYLQAKYSDALVVRVGSADLPWMPFAEDVYGYRYVENILPDRMKAGTSADWGVHVLGKLGIASYAVSAINGNGYKNPTRSRSIDLEGRVSTTLSGVTLGLGGYTGKLGKNVEGVTTQHDATRWNALAAYKIENFRIGAEYFRTRNWNSVLTATTDSADGWSLFSSYAFTPQISAFGRYDWVKARKTATPTVDDNYFNVGLQWEPTRIVDFALVYKRDEARHGLISTSNGPIGGSNKGSYDEFGIWGQYRW